MAENDTHRIGLILPRKLHESLKEIAAAQKRSVTGQIVYELEKAVEAKHDRVGRG